MFLHRRPKTPDVSVCCICFNRTFLNLLALVGYDTSTALIVLEIILSCESVGEPLPAAIALIEASGCKPVSGTASGYFALKGSLCSFLLLFFLPTETACLPTNL